MITARRGEHGAALVEFALVSLVLYVLLAGGIELGRLMFAANAVQDAARLAARELAVAPLRAEVTFEYALTCSPADDPGCLVDLRRRVFDPACLVVNMTDPAVSADPEAYFASLPVVNRALRGLMITEPERPNLVRYPGALMGDLSGAPCSAVGPNGQAGATGLTVGIPLVTSRGGGGETITWVPVLEEIRAEKNCPSRGAFSLAYLSALDECGPLEADPLANRGLAAVRINYPFQAATLSAFQPAPPTVTDPLPPNWAGVIDADDSSVLENNAAPGSTLDSGAAAGTYAGPYGLGRQLAFAGRTVRPYRRLVSAQAIHRREVFQ